MEKNLLRTIFCNKESDFIKNFSIKNILPNKRFFGNMSITNWRLSYRNYWYEEHFPIGKGV